MGGSAFMHNESGMPIFLVYERSDFSQGVANHV
jgi:hypothetical protein